MARLELNTSWELSSACGSTNTIAPSNTHNNVRATRTSGNRAATRDNGIGATAMWSEPLSERDDDPRRCSSNASSTIPKSTTSTVEDLG